MTIQELTERDYKKAVKAFEQAEKRPNLPKEELVHVKQLMKLRKKIMEICANT